jgi:hypothetical protein
MEILVKQLTESIKDKDDVINDMQAEIKSLRDSLSQMRTQEGIRSPRNRKVVALSYQVEADGVLSRARVARQASVATAQALSAFPVESTDELASKMIDVFRKPLDKIDYLHSSRFAHDLIQLCERVKPIFEAEDRCLFLESPSYVFGDIHGNLEDLNFFADHLWRLGTQLTAGRFLFLGDYVDRGMNGLECVAYLFALKMMSPTKLFMLRGNHETRDVNGWEDHYGDRSFLRQCRARFGRELGEQVWETVNQVFDRLPLAGVIDNDIFCVHGGLPRPSKMHEVASRVEDLLAVPRVAGISPVYEYESRVLQQLSSDCIWSDPALSDMEHGRELNELGFGESLRGGGAVCFGNRAVDNFLAVNEFSYIVRAHEAHAEGVGLSKGARVFTVFSTSKDHGQGNGAVAGCILVDHDAIRVINRSAKYKNKFVHRRQSATAAGVAPAHVEKAICLGLVLNVPHEPLDRVLPPPKIVTTTNTATGVSTYSNGAPGERVTDATATLAALALHRDRSHSFSTDECGSGEEEEEEDDDEMERGAPIDRM